MKQWWIVYWLLVICTSMSVVSGGLTPLVLIGTPNVVNTYKETQTACAADRTESNAVAPKSGKERVGLNGSYVYILAGICL